MIAHPTPPQAPVRPYSGPRFAALVLTLNEAAAVTGAIVTRIRELTEETAHPECQSARTEIEADIETLGAVLNRLSGAPHDPINRG